MRCPECGSPDENGAPACGNCGLLLLTLEKPQRRSEDLRGESRRATDRPWTQCEFCKAEIEASAIRCRHCSEVVDEKSRAETTLRKTSIRLPLLTRRQLVLAFSPLVVALAVFAVNFYRLQHPMNQVLRENAAYRGIQINTRYAFWMNPGVVVYDLEGVSGSQSRLDVHTVLLEYAKRLRSRNVRRVELRYRGDLRFSVDGASFRQLGEEYAKRNYAFALFEFTRAVGGTNDQDDIDGREALIRFHDLWYADALLSSGGP